MKRDKKEILYVNKLPPNPPIPSEPNSIYVWRKDAKSFVYVYEPDNNRWIAPGFDDLIYDAIDHVVENTHEADYDRAMSVL